ncbi:MAG: hypothetical protein AAF403_06565, partial [Pseudomonadota bacterium]
YFRKGDGVDKITDFDVSKSGDVLVLSGFKASDLSFSVNNAGKAVITFNNSSDMIVLDNVKGIDDLKHNMVDFSDQEDRNQDGKLGAYELLDKVVTPVTKDNRPSALKGARIVLLDDEQDDFLGVNPIDDTYVT